MRHKRRNPILTVKDYRLKVHLGCTLEEQMVPQEISATIKIKFRESPPGEITDDLRETICYADICHALTEYLQNKSFQLVEKLANDCFNVLKTSYPNVLIQLEIHKLHPPIENLQGGVVYLCGDMF